jgi:hypothetical protein
MIFTGTPFISWRSRVRLIWTGLIFLFSSEIGAPGLANSGPVAGVNIRLVPYLDRADASPVDELARLNDARLQLVRKAAFDAVRVGIPAEAWVENASPAERDRHLTLLRSMLDSAVSANLRVQVALFVPARQIVCEARYSDSYRLGLSAVLAVLPDRPDIAIEPINEPPSCRKTAPAAEPWEHIQQQLYREVRSVRQHILFVVAAPGWGRVDGLLHLDPGPYRSDPNTAFTFHYYEPLLFTHQQVAWLRPDHLNKFVTSLAWPVEQRNVDQVREDALAALAGDNSLRQDQRAEDQRTLLQLFEEYRTQGTTRYLASRFQAAAEWAAAHDLTPNRILLGEFGVHRQVLGADRVSEPWPTASAWLNAVRHEAERHGMGWVAWDLDSGFGVICGNRPGEGELCPEYRTVFRR